MCENVLVNALNNQGFAPDQDGASHEKRTKWPQIDDG
jgi:hypothetical protein